MKNIIEILELNAQWGIDNYHLFLAGSLMRCRSVLNELNIKMINSNPIDVLETLQKWLISEKRWNDAHIIRDAIYTLKSLNPPVEHPISINERLGHANITNNYELRSNLVYRNGFVGLWGDWINRKEEG